MNTVRIKTCGITTVEDARACADLGVDYLGVIFAHSPRRVTAETARRIKEAAPNVPLVGVFQNEDLARAVQQAAAARLDFVQLHGREGAAYISILRRRTGLPVIKVLRAGEMLSPKTRDAALAADYLLLDRAKHAHDQGPEFLDQEARRATEEGFRVFLAGGLEPGNVRRLTEKARPFGVDVCSGIETEPGRKDHEALERFIAEVRN